MRTIILSVLLFCACALKAQILERKVTIKLQNEKISKVLEILSETSSFSFSYSPSAIDVNKKVTVIAENRSIREVLDKVFNGSVDYQQIGNHLILQKKIQPKKTQTQSVSNPKYSYAVSGYLRDFYSGNGLLNASVYEKNTLTNAISGDFGYYQVKFTSKENTVHLHYSLAGYFDTVIEIKYSGIAGNLNVNLLPLQAPSLDEPLLPDSMPAPMFTDTIAFPPADTSKKPVNPSEVLRELSESKFAQWLGSTVSELNIKNIRDSFNRDWQFSFLPSMGTNGAMAPLVSNKFSVNLVAGYNGGLTGLELGGFANLIKKNMYGMQVAGFGNVVGGEASGAQFAGFANHNFGGMKGLMAAGFYNFTQKKSMGTQVAGCLNVCHGKYFGTQVAGLGNYSREHFGTQISSGFNYAHKLHGVQIGIVNIADSSNGFSLGLFNFIGNGIHQLEFNFNESRAAGITFRSGNRKFYTFYGLNMMEPFDAGNAWIGYGFGFGSSMRIWKPIYLNIDLQAHQMTHDLRTDFLRLWNRANLDLEIKLHKRFALFAGVSTNVLVTDAGDTDIQELQSMFTRTNIVNESGSYPVKGWSGFQFGLRIL